MFQYLEFNTPPFFFCIFISCINFFFWLAVFYSASYRGFFFKNGGSFFLVLQKKNGPLVTGKLA